MPITKEHTSLDDFADGVIAGLVRNGETDLDETDRTKLHQAFVAAFELVKAELAPGELSFGMLVSADYGTIAAVDQILDYWMRSDFSIKDRNSTAHHFLMKREVADNKLETLTGGSALYDKAAGTLMTHLNASLQVTAQA